MLEKIIYQNQPELKEKIASLLVEAFPEDERPPVFYFFKSLERKGNQLIAFYDNETFIGFVYITLYQDICYIFFLAVQRELRNKGYGTMMINSIKEEYRRHVLLICYEEVDPIYPNYEERKRREAFYRRLGFLDNELTTIEWGVRFKTAYMGEHNVDFLTYKEIFKLGFGNQAEEHLKKAS